MEKLLVIEDSEAIRNQLTLGLGADYVVVHGEDHVHAMEQFARHSPKVVILDLGLPPEEDGTYQAFRCLEDMLAGEPGIKVVVLVDAGQRELAFHALQRGAYDFYEKPVEVPPLRVMVQRAYHLASLEAERAWLQQALMRRAAGIEGLVGQCPAMQRVFSTLHRVASSDVPVLIVGESGTGRRTMARALSSLSLRGEGPFVAVSCGAVPAEMLESELFGVEEGHGGNCGMPGRIDYAQRGTLFLEELEALPQKLQLKLLRVLEERKFLRVGGKRDERGDARLVGAAEPGFPRKGGQGVRSDFLRAVSAVKLELPPLRERGDDIVLLAQLFLQKAAQTYHKKVRGFTPAAISAIQSHAWPGNVRELENRVQRGVLMSDAPLLELQALGFAEEHPEPPPMKLLTLREARDMVERGAILAAVGTCGGNMVKASEILGVCRPTLYDLMRKHGLHKGTRTGPPQTETVMVPSRGMS